MEGLLLVVAGLSDVTAVGAVRCWGYNGSGQLGTGNTTTSVTASTTIGL